MIPHNTYPKGQLRRINVYSHLLKNSCLGDPQDRNIDVYTPYGFENQHLPLLVDLAPYTNSGLGRTAWKNFGENLPQRLDRLIGSKVMKPAIIAFPDCFTRLGGNQYINSHAMGPWADILIQEFVPAIESQFRCGGNGKRGLFGKSSGGYGALVHGLLYSDFWSAIACHSGDIDFELCYARDFPNVLRTIAKAGSIKTFIHKLEAREKVSGSDIHTLMTLAMAATYDPCNESYLGIRLPVDIQTCERLPELWQNWLKWDPLTLVETHSDALKTLKALHIDCGSLDQYDLVYGARRMTKRLSALNVAHRYEEFDGTHSGIDHRLDVSLPYLVEALS